MWPFKKPVYGTGGIQDIKDDRDFKYEELILTAPVIEWKEKKSGQWRTFPITYQDGSGSCVAHTVAKLLGIENYLEEGKYVQYSSRDIYSKGYVEPAGMYYKQGMEIGYKDGATFEQLMPSQGLNEQLMRDSSDRKPLDQHVAKIGKGGNYFSIPIDFDQIASVIATGKGVALGQNFDNGMWATGEVKNKKNGMIGHAVAVVDYCIWKGQKALIFDNSWDYRWGFNGQGVLTEDQIEGVNTAWYFASLPNNWQEGIAQQGNKPKFTFNYIMKVGDKNLEVTKLQECLRWDGEFPVSIPATGYFGGITRDAVLKFQKKYAIIETGKVDEDTLKKLNELFR